MKDFHIEQWINSKGEKTPPLKLTDFEGKFKVIFCFQHWCPGCHSKGLPDLKKMTDAFKENDKVIFLAIQTVFEGYDENTFEKLSETQQKYNLNIFFGHDAGSKENPGSTFMKTFQTRGTPWFLVLDKHNNIVFSDFHLDVDSAIDYLKKVS